MLVQVSKAVLIISWIVGAASLARLSPDWTAYWPFIEFRFMLLLPLLALMYVCYARGLLRGSVSTLDLFWLAALLMAHLMVAASWSWSTADATRIRELYEVLLLVAMLPIAVILASRDPSAFLELIFKVAYWAGVLVTVLALALFGTVAGELGAIGAGGIGLSRASGLATIGGLYLWAKDGRSRWLLPVPFFIGTILLSGSRAAALALGVSLLGLFLRWASVRSGNRRSGVGSILAGLLLLVGLLAAMALTEAGRQAVVVFVLQSFSGGDLESGQLYYADRDVIFRDAWTRFTASPWIGAGLGSYYGPFSEEYPHNLFLSFAVDGGLAPLVLASGCALLPFVGWMRSKSRESSFAYAAAFFFLVVSFFAGAYYDARWFWLFSLLGMQLARQCAAPGSGGNR